MDSEKINFLYKAIEDTQQIIRFTETKVGIIFLLFGIYVSMIGSGLPDFAKYIWNMNITMRYFFFGVIILFFFSVLLIVWSVIMIVYPRSNPSEHIIIGDDNKHKSFFYIADLKVKWRDSFLDRKQLKIGRSFEAYLTGYGSINTIKQLENELILELLKVSYLRELKIKRMRNTKYLLLVSIILSLILIVFHFIGLSCYMPPRNLNFIYLR